MFMCACVGGCVCACLFDRLCKTWLRAVCVCVSVSLSASVVIHFESLGEWREQLVFVE